MVALIAIATTSTSARADVDWQLALGTGGAWIRSLPTFRSSEVQTSARTVRSSDVRTRGGIGLMGLGTDLELTIDDRWRVPIVGAAFYWPVGDYDTMITGVDGSIARLRPWSAGHLDFLLPGIGRRVKSGRWMWSAVVRTGFTIEGMAGSVAAGREREDISLTSVSPLVQVDLEGCRRLDPTFRACLVVAPRVYNFALLNGVNVGLRLEWGR